MIALSPELIAEGWEQHVTQFFSEMTKLEGIRLAGKDGIKIVRIRAHGQLMRH